MRVLRVADPMVGRDASCAEGVGREFVAVAWLECTSAKSKLHATALNGAGARVEFAGPPCEHVVVQLPSMSLCNYYVWRLQELLRQGLEPAQGVDWAAGHAYCLSGRDRQPCGTHSAHRAVAW